MRWPHHVKTGDQLGLNGKLRAEALAEFLDGWEAAYGVLTAQELARAERELGMAGADSPA